MPAKKNPSLSDIWKKLGQQDAILKQIHTQVKDTNGRLLVVEKWKDSLEIGKEAVENYKLKHPEAKTPQEKAEGWSVREKALIAIITTLLALMGTLIGTKL